jgi:cytochrome b
MTEAVKCNNELVWDIGVRAGHWIMVVCIGYLILFDNRFPGHDTAGYIVLAIVLWRWLWGFIGSRYARFTSFLFGPRETLEYIVSAFRFGKAKEYTSHNPMGALMVFALLATLPVASISGVMLMGAQRYAGPLEGLIPTEWEFLLESVHYGSVWLLEGLILIHVLGTLWASWWHRENYIRSMITGKKNRYRRRSKRTSATDRLVS